MDKKSKRYILALMRNIGTIIRKYVNVPVEALIKKLNPVLRGWANYHRHVIASRTFSRVDDYVHKMLWNMLHRRHPKKSKGWLYRKYWLTSGKRWIFGITIRREGKVKQYKLVKISSIGII